MLKRIVTGMVMFAILLPLVFIENKICEILYALLSVLMCITASYEFSTNSQIKTEKKKKNYLLFLFCGLLALSALNATYQMSEGNYYYHIVTLLLFGVFSFVLMTIGVFSQNEKDDMIKNIFCMLYTGIMLGYAMSLRYYSPINLSRYLNLGNKCFLFVYLIGVITDSFAYLFGRKLGKHKLIPSVSPKKSVEGAIFGLIGGGLGGILGMFVFGILKTEENLFSSALICFAISIVISVLVQIGDLVESKLKRGFNVKDFGYILPGHGGILDRFDSYLFSGFFVFVVLTLIEFTFVL